MSRTPVYCDQCGTKLRADGCRVCDRTPIEVASADSIDPAHKIKTYDELHSMCVEHINEVVSGNHVECDCDHYIFEVVMMACAGKDIFSKLYKYGG